MAQEIIDALGHSWNDGVVTKEATRTENGVMTYTCTVCGETRTESIAATGRITEDGDDSSNGGNTTTRAVAAEESDNGSVVSDLTRAASGAAVTLTVTPDEGYELENLIVTNISTGETVPITKISDTQYTFTMPAARVSVDATFVELPDAETNTEEETHVCSCEQYADVDTDLWYHEYIDYVVENGLMNGTSTTTFGPNEATTRSMIVTILYRLEGEPAVTGASGFADVADDAWYAEAITWASQIGIVSGYGDGNYGPDDIITREQMATILFRYAQTKGYSNTGEAASLLSFADSGEAGEYAVPALQWAVGSGIIEGTGTATLSPLGSATRAQIAAVLVRLIENVTNSR
ncbi:MAG: S-layer homology domain-containing protein [Oscillospiraceae bacterium]|nr:S-layer homology domain-containing protein [Oscillospiraceae bacterium]